MWVKVACANGHSLKVRTKYAGHTGKCPQCGGGVAIPTLTEEQMFELLDAGARKAAPVVAAAQAPDKLVHESSGDDEDSALSMGSTMLKRLPKTCPKCKQQCSPNYTICPNCRTILPLSGMSDAAELMGRPKASIHCPDCGATSFPGSTVCTNCGVPLIE